MRRLSILTLSFFILLASDVWAQQSGANMEGRVVDAETDEPLHHATIGVWDVADESLVTGTTTNTVGEFYLEGIQPGTYNIRITYIGYMANWVNELELTSGATAELGTIPLVEDEAALGELVVEGEREFMESRVDRTIYNVRDQPISIGGTATDILETLPSLEVDMDGNISLRGNENVAIHINGRPAPARGDFLSSFLQQIPAENIERIEVIPNPSARYQAEGMSGIVNIVLRDDRDIGLGGGVTASIGTNDTYNASGNLNYQSGPWSGNAQYGFRHNTRIQDGWNFRENRYLSPLTILEQDNRGENMNRSHMLNTQLGYQFTDQITLTGSANVSYRDGGREGINTYTELTEDRDLMRQYNRENLQDQLGFNQDYRFTLERIVDRSNHEMSAELRFNATSREDDETYLQEEIASGSSPFANILDQQRSELQSDRRDISFRLDYMRPLGDLKFEAGYRGSIEQFDDDFYSESYDEEEETFQPDVNLINQFVFDQTINAGYVVLSGEQAAIGWQGGLRAEHTATAFDLTTTGELYENNHFGLFPSMHLNYEFREGTEAKIGYTRRMRRPRTRQLNPFTSFDDPLNIFVGNPALEPEVTDAFELDLRQMTGWGAITATPFFRRSHNVMRRVMELEDGVSISTFDNFATSDSYGMDFVTSARWGQRLNGFASVSAYRAVTDGTNVADDLRSDAFGWNLRGNLNAQLRDGLTLQFFAFYRAPMEVERGRMSSFSMANIGLRQNLFGERAQLSLRVSDLFDNRGFSFQSTGDGYYQESSQRWDSRSIRLSFTYNFGQERDRRNRRPQDQDDQVPDIDGMPLQ